MSSKIGEKKTFNIFSILSVLVVILYSLIRCSKGPATKYNVIMIISDALRKDILSCYGGSARTPNIDWLAKNGVLFERAYSTAPCTLPSSVAMLTGNYSRAYITGVNNEEDHERAYYLNGDEKLLGEVLKERGYDVRMNIENGLANRSNTLQGCEKLKHITNMSEKEIDFVESITGITNIGGDVDPHLSSKYDKLYGLLHYLLTIPLEKSFLIFKWFSDPHAPYSPPQKFLDRITFDTSRLPKEERYYSTMKSTYTTKSLTTEEVMYIKELYEAEVESVDERIGFIIKALKHNDLLENTFIIFTSDHGEFLGEHGRLLHTNAFYEQLVNIPLIIVGPKIPKGKKENTQISLIDVIPTLKNMLEVEYSNDLQGKSFYPLLSGSPLQQDRDIYFDSIWNGIVEQSVNSDALLRGEYKLMTFIRNNKPVFKLYNLNDDPDESKDISENHPEIVREMYKKILDLRKDCDIRAEDNIRKIDEKVDLHREATETLKELKSLGYIK